MHSDTLYHTCIVKFTPHYIQMGGMAGNVKHRAWVVVEDSLFTHSVMN